MKTIDCKKAIVAKLQTQIGLDDLLDECFGAWSDVTIEDEFGNVKVYDTPEKLRATIAKVSSWKRVAKEKGDNPGEIIRTFDCDPFEEQLGAWVTTSGERVVDIVFYLK